MLALLSPAKKLDFNSEWKTPKTSQPTLLAHAEELVDTLGDLPKPRLQKLMKLSDKLAELNYQRYKRFSTPFTKTNARPAITAFKGDTYVGLDAETLSSADLSYAQKHVGILSGLYGLLRPLDLMQPYRLEMGTKLATEHGATLYEFWGHTITEAVNKAVKGHKDKTVVSLASNEYIKSVQAKNLKHGFLTCYFKELKHGEPKTIGLFAKRARGMMARYMVENRIETPEKLKNFNEDGYAFVPSLSDEENYLFLR